MTNVWEKFMGIDEVSSALNLIEQIGLLCFLCYFLFEYRDRNVILLNVLYYLPFLSFALLSG